MACPPETVTRLSHARPRVGLQGSSAQPAGPRLGSWERSRQPCTTASACCSPCSSLRTAASATPSWASPAPTAMARARAWAPSCFRFFDLKQPEGDPCSKVGLDTPTFVRHIGETTILMCHIKLRAPWVWGPSKKIRSDMRGQVAKALGANYGWLSLEVRPRGKLLLGDVHICSPGQVRITAGCCVNLLCRGMGRGCA